MIKNKKLINAVYISVISLILIVLFLLALRIGDTEFPLTVIVKSAEMDEEIAPWYDDNGTWYFFLPSYAELNDTVLCANKKGCFLDGTGLDTEQTLDFVDINREYNYERHTFRIDEKAKIVFMKSANVATIFIDTVSGKMYNVHADKENKERISISLYNETGEQLYRSNDYTDEISGRGNSTWYSEKKPYNIELSEPTGLLGMAEAQKWVLLANAIDETNLRNKLVYDTANLIGLEWTPKCDYVDLFLNGEYKGLYLLTEKVEIAENKINIDLQSGVLLSQTFSNRAQDVDAFTLDSGRVYYVVSPKQINDDKKAEVTAHMQDVENAIISQKWENCIDVESWVRKSLLEECFNNADVVSLYIYWDEADKRIHAGPAWDYDNALGNSFWGDIHVVNPYRFLLEPESHENSENRSWANILYRSESFRELCRHEFIETFEPIFNDLVSKGITEQALMIKSASEMNSLRWKGMFDNQPVHSNADDVLSYISKRFDFLKRLWIDNKEFYKVEFGDYAAFYVESGTAFGEIPAPSLFGLPDDTVWHNQSDLSLFDPTQVIFEDVKLLPSSTADNDSLHTQETEVSENVLTQNIQSVEWILSHKALFLAFVFITTFGLSGVVLLYIDIKRNSKGGRHGKR